MSNHAFLFDSEDDINHIFKCVKCGYKMGFNKPGVGEPTADMSSGSPVFPEHGHAYCPPCDYTLPGEV